MLGLQQPTSGRIVIDNHELSEANIPSWRAAIGYVPQDIFLIDDTIANNIAFGCSHKELDLQHLERVAGLLKSMILSLVTSRLCNACWRSRCKTEWWPTPENAFGEGALSLTEGSLPR